MEVRFWGKYVSKYVSMKIYRQRHDHSSAISQLCNQMK